MADAKDLIGAQYSHAEHFANNESFEVQRTNHFEVVLDLGALDLPANYAEHIRLSIKSIGAPQVSVEQLELRHGNDVVKVAKSPTYNDLQITVHDTIGQDQIDVLQTWFDRIFSRKSRLMGLVKNYKTTGTLYMYSPDCSIIRKWHLEGIWPKNYGMGSDFTFDGTGDGQTVNFELSVDRYWEERATKRNI